MLNDDPIVEEVRTHGMEFAVRHDNDIGHICAALRKEERSQGHKVVHRKPKRVERETAS